MKKIIGSETEFQSQNMKRRGGMVEQVDLGRFSYKKVRKHVSQLSLSEKEEIRKKFKKVKYWEIIDHVNERIVQKEYKITTDDILNVMRNGEIVEYEQKLYVVDGKMSELLVLTVVREDENGKNRLYLVFDITDKKIVTLWINGYEDTHDTLDMGIYSKGLKVGENYWQE